MPGSDHHPNEQGKNPPRAIGRIGLWLSGAALIGSAALVIWNRRALKSLREAAEKPAILQSDRDDEGIY
jgi:hypothetical protein